MDVAGEPPHADAHANATITYPTALRVFTSAPRNPSKQDSARPSSAVAPMAHADRTAATPVRAHDANTSTVGR